MNVTTLGFFNLPGNSELLIILAIGLLLFGKRLPEVGRSLGKGIVEFKRGLKDISEDIDASEEGRSSPGKLERSSGQSLPEGDARRVAQPGAAEHSAPPPSAEPQSNG